MKLDILAIAVHPDDVELSCAGTLLKQKQLGYTTGILDLTQGELGTRGTPELRMQEAEAAAKILQLDYRANLGIRDGMFFNQEEDVIMGIIRFIRFLKPDLILANAPTDRHPDHGRASKLTADACFYSGLRKISTQWDGIEQEVWRPKQVLFYIQDRYIKPDILVDISEQFESKMQAIAAFSSQFYNPNSEEPLTPISNPEFFTQKSGRESDLARNIGTSKAEGFVFSRISGIDNLMLLK